MGTAEFSTFAGTLSAPLPQHQLGAHRKYSLSPGPPLLKRLTPGAYFRRDGGRGKDAGTLLGALDLAGSAAVEAGASASGREVTRCPRIRISARRVGTMRLGSGTFAAGCVVIEVLGVALFLRGFFPAPVFSGTERQAESPAPEPSAGTSAPPLPPASLLPGPYFALTSLPSSSSSRGSRGGSLPF